MIRGSQIAKVVEIQILAWFDYAFACDLDKRAEYDTVAKATLCIGELSGGMRRFSC
jgi:hypothetical protein